MPVSNLSSESLPWLAGETDKAPASAPEAAIPQGGVFPIAKDAVPPPPSKLVVTSGPARAQGMKDDADLASILASIGAPVQSADPEKVDPTTYSDDFTQSLDAASKTSSAATKSLISGIQATYLNSRNKAMMDADSYKRGLQLLGVQHNESTFSPDLLASHITAAGNDAASKLRALDVEKNKALMDAEVAQTNGDIQAKKEKMDYVRQIQKDQQSAVTDAYTNLSKTNDAATVEAHTIYDSLQTLNPADQEQFIQAVAQKYNLPVMSLVTALADEKQKRTVDAVDLQNKERLANGGGTSTTKAGLIANIDSIFSNKTKDASGYSVLGDDTYIDPQAYLQAYQTWMSKGYGAKQFATQYPAKDYINPESYALLPNPLQPSDDTSGQGS